VIPAGFLLAVLLNAGIVLQTQGLSVNAMLAINGVILIFAAVGEVAASYRLVRITPQAFIVPVEPSPVSAGSGDAAAGAQAEERR
jgi:hypothetical protein